MQSKNAVRFLIAL